MKKQFKFLSAAIIFVVLSSCTGKGGIPEVKLIPVRSGEEFQYIDKEGKIVINPQFSAASVFRNGIALVKTTGKDQKWGYIDETGKYLINAQYKYATIFNEGLAWVVVENGAPTAINEKGEIKITLQNAEEVRLFSEELAAFSTIDKDGKTKWGFMDKNGNVKINPQFAQVGRFSESKCAVANEERKWGYIDDNGKISINYQFDNAKDFSDNKAVVSLDNKYGVISKDGKYIVNPQFIEMITDGAWFAIKQNDKWGWCDNNGKIVVNPQFVEINLFNSNKLAPVKSGNQWGYIDKEGKMAINPQFTIGISFNGNLSLVVSANKIGFINEEGKFIVNPQFDNISDDYVCYIGAGMIIGLNYGNNKTIYESVITDFFNVDAVTNVINLTNPEGFSLNSTFGEIMKKLNLQESSFNQYSGYQHTVIASKKITNDVSYSFNVIGTAYEAVSVTRNNGWYTYNDTEYKFKGNNNVTAFNYYLFLSGKGYGKSKSLIESFVSKLSGFKKGKLSYGNMFFDNKIKIIFTGNDSSVTIQISQPDGTEVVDNDMKILLDSDRPAIDSTAVVVDTAVVAR